MNEPNPQDAIKELERCAARILDDPLSLEYTHEALTRLFEDAFGESPRSFKADTVIPVNADADGESAYAVSLIRGVILNLDGDMRLASVSVIPHKIRERDRLMSIVGIGHDPMRDVAARHDDYLAEQSPHASP